jgi:hypothetical protein
MFDPTVGSMHTNWAATSARAVSSFAAFKALLALDGQLGPLTFESRRAMALATVATLAEVAIAASRGWRLVAWASVSATLALLAQAQSVPVALIAFVLALAAIECGANAVAVDTYFPAGLIQSCFAFVALGLVLNLVPQAAIVPDSAARAGSQYISRVREFDSHFEFIVLGGKAGVLAVLFLLWNWRGPS